MIELNRRHLLVGAGLSLIVPAKAAWAAEHSIDMLNADPEDKKRKMVFIPRVLGVEPGDTVTFVPADKSHSVESMKGMIPEGAETWKGKLNKEVAVTFDMPGVYGYQCKPHYAMGMVGLIVVNGEGKLANLEAAQGVKQRGKAKAAWEEIWAEAEEMGLLSESTA